MSAARRLRSSSRRELASDTRGTGPFQPVAADGSAIGPPQYPTTLPTLDELIGIDDVTVDNVHHKVLALTRRADQDHVYTLHAELEGMKLRPVLQRLITGWREQGHSLVDLSSLRATRREVALPRHRIECDLVPGRSGVVAVQGRKVESPDEATDAGRADTVTV